MRRRPALLLKRRVLQMTGGSLHACHRNDVGSTYVRQDSAVLYCIVLEGGQFSSCAQLLSLCQINLLHYFCPPGEIEMRGWALALLLLWGVYCRGSAAQNETLAASSQLLTGAEITNGTMLTVCTSDVPPLVCWGEPVDANL